MLLFGGARQKPWFLVSHVGVTPCSKGTHGGHTTCFVASGRAEASKHLGGSQETASDTRHGVVTTFDIVH